MDSAELIRPGVGPATTRQAPLATKLTHAFAVELTVGIGAGAVLIVALVVWILLS